jgi:hypothetical protein
MEKEVLIGLQFDLQQPTSHSLLSYFIKVSIIDKEVCFVAAFLCDLSLLSSDIQIEFTPSEIALTALFLSCQSSRFKKVC